MGITRDTVEVVLCSSLELTPREARSIAGEMSRRELMEVLNARRHHDGLTLVGQLVPIVLRVEMRAIDETDDGAVCEVIDRARTRMQMAEATTRSTCWPSSKASTATSSSTPTINVTNSNAPSDVSPPIQN